MFLVFGVFVLFFGGRGKGDTNVVSSLLRSFVCQRDNESQYFGVVLGLFGLLLVFWLFGFFDAIKVFKEFL